MTHFPQNWQPGHRHENQRPLLVLLHDLTVLLNSRIHLPNRKSSRLFPRFRLIASGASADAESDESGDCCNDPYGAITGALANSLIDEVGRRNHSIITDEIK